MSAFTVLRAPDVEHLAEIALLAPPDRRPVTAAIQRRLRREHVQATEGGQ